MTLPEEIITIALCGVASLVTRFLPFAIFKASKPTPPFIRYLGDALPLAVFAMLVVYCVKDVRPLTWPHGLPEALGIVFTAALHAWRRHFMVSVAGGTIFYMLLVQFVFTTA